MNQSLFPLFLLLIFAFSSTIQTLTILGYGIKDLESNDPIAFQKEADWWNMTASIPSAKITQTTVTQKWLLGGPNILGHGSKSTFGMSFSRTYNNLPSHTYVTITALFWYFDNFGGVANFSPVKLDPENELSYFNPQINPSIDFTIEDGGRAGINDLGRDHVAYGLTHTTSTLTVSFVSSGRLNSSVQSFGFRELHIHLRNDEIANIPNICHISEDVSSLSSQQCPCPIGQAKDSSGNCASCAVNCDFCYGTTPEECLACNAGALWDGTECSTCHLMCKTCTGTTSNDCSTCKYGYYNYGNNTCMESCKFPFVVEKIGKDLFCNPRCTSPQFYWAANKTCLDKCDFPLLHAPDENGIEICRNPCPSPSDFLYMNGSCSSVCQAPLVLKFDSGTKFCLNPCPETDYLYPNRSCLSSCPSPLLSRSEPGTQYCWNPCLGAKDYLFNNGSCGMTCPTPLISRYESGVRYCYTPCSSVNDYIYDNKSCFNSCSSPLASRTEPFVARYCLNPCPSNNYFLYPNGSCFVECHWPLLSRTESGIRYCYSPCASSPSDFIYPNSTCMDKCPFPLMSRSESGFTYCYSPCPLTKYLYSDQLCYDYCASPLIERLESGGINYCNTPCHRTADYVYPDGVCRSVCEYPYRVGNNPVYKVCLMDEIQSHQADSLANLIDITNTICGVGGLLTGFILPGDPTSMLMWSLLRMLQFSRVMEVNFPAQLTKVFAKQNDNYLEGHGYMSSYGRVLAAGEDLGKFKIPENFLKNYWQQLIVFGVFGIMMVISVGLLHLLKSPKAIKLTKYLKSALKWNVMLMFFCGTYGDLIFSSIIEFQSADFPSKMGFWTCLFMIILAVYIPVKILYVIKTLRYEKDAQNNWLHNRVFFEAYKSDQAIQHIFLFIYLMRVAFFNIILGILLKSPFAQALLVNFISFAMLVYLLSKTPMKDKFCFYQQVLMESSLFVYNLCILILAFMDLADAQTESTRAFFGGVMIVIMIMAPLGTAVLIILKMILRINQLYLQYKTQQEALELVGSRLTFKKVRARGKFIIGENTENSNLNNETLNLTSESNQTQRMIVTELDEGVPQKQNQDSIRDIRRNYYVPASRILRNRRLHGEGSSMNIHLESNLETSSVEISTKKGLNGKRRKINIFKDDNYLPD